METSGFPESCESEEDKLKFVREVQEMTKVVTAVLLSSGRKTLTLQCDSGREFIGGAFQKLLKDNNVNFRTMLYVDIIIPYIHV